MVDEVTGTSGATPESAAMLKRFNLKVKDDYKSVEPISIHNPSGNGAVKRVDGLKITLSNGATVELPKQGKGATIIKTANNEYDFEKLKDANIDAMNVEENTYSIYRLMGCQFSDISTINKASERIEIANHSDGTKSVETEAYYDKRDNAYSHTNNLSGLPDGWLADREDGSSNSGKEIEYGRHKYITSKDGKETVEYTSHDDITLKESYVNATEKKFKDGYSVRTSPDGKSKWYFDPQGKPITPKEFVEAKHPYKVVYKK